MEIYFRASEDLQLPLPGLGFEPFSSLKSSPTVAESWPSDGPISPTSVTFDTPQTLSLFADESQFSQQESHASRLVLPGSEKAQQMTVGSGRQLSMLLSASDPLGAFSKILLESSVWTHSEEYCYVWQILDTRFGLSAFQLTPLGQSTDDSGCLLWRSPNASDVTGGPMDGERRLAQGHQLNLQEQAATPKLWPTPSAGNFNDGENPEQWLARQAELKKKGINGNGAGIPLGIAAKLWPTPTVPNGGRRNPEGTSITGKRPDGRKAQIDLWEAAGLEGSGSLSPRFVEQLLGFEIDHTALEHSVIPSCRRKRSRSSKQSIKSKQH
jgi:hypothetical protein